MKVSSMWKVGAVVALLGLAPQARAEEPAMPSARVDRSFQQLFAAEAGLPSVPTDDAAPAETAPAQALNALDSALQESLSGIAQSDSAAASRASTSAETAMTSRGSGGTAWGPLVGQSVAMLTFMHAFRATFEDGTWDETLRGEFWTDYFNSVETLCCWGDGDNWTTNWLFHPMLGSTAAFMFANNNRDSQATPVANTGAYWTVKGKQLAFAAVYSTYFEIGLVLSESAIGNVGLTPGQQTYCDIVITPVLGVGWSIGEDVLRRYIIDWVDRRNHFWGATLGIFLNPTRAFANVFAFKVPWAPPEWSTASRRPAQR